MIFIGGTENAESKGVSGEIMKNTISNNYRPHQPDFELRPHYFSKKPEIGDPLLGIVYEFYQFDSLDGVDDPYIWVIPDACTDIMVIYSSTDMNCYISGSAKSYATLDALSSYKTFFGVRFCSGALCNLFSLSTRDAAGIMINSQSIFLNREDVPSRLSEAVSFSKRVGIVTEYILNRLSEDYQPVPLVNYVVSYIIERGGQVSIAELEHYTGYSNRYIRKLFDTHVGLSPKVFSEIVKFQRSYHIYSASDEKICMADLAADCGYYDQTHMNKTYKRYAKNLLTNLPKLDMCNLTPPPSLYA